MKSIHLVLIADIHIGPDHFWKTVPGQEVPRLLDDFVETVNEELKPDAVVDLGDRIQTKDAETDQKNLKYVIQRLDNELGMPCYHILGNHDVINVSREEQNTYAKYTMGPSSFFVGGFKLVLLNTLDPLLMTMGGRIGDGHAQWLEQTMQEDAIPKLVFGHHPIDGHDWSRNRIIDRKTGEYTFLQNAKQIKGIIEKGRHTILYVGAHMHWFSFLQDKAMTYMVAPAFSEAHPNTQNAPGLFFELKVSEDGSVATVLHGLHPRRALGRISNTNW